MSEADAIMHLRDELVIFKDELHKLGTLLIYLNTILCLTIGLAGTYICLAIKDNRS